MSQFFDTLFSLDGHFSSWTGSSALNPEARLIFVIAAKGSLSVKEAMYDSTLSNRAFYQLVNRMKRARKIKVVGDPNDGRVRRIVFEPQFLETLPFAENNSKLVSSAHYLVQKILDDNSDIKIFADG